MTKKFPFLIIFILSLNLYTPFIFAAQNITQYSLDDLMNMEVTSVSRSSRPLSQSAAAVTVINQEDIRRSPATTVPELLRTVPGLDVARITANQWAISARGFNGALGNKMLILIDGRVAYSRLHSGIYWDVQDLLLDNIDRIEIIRGPGGSVWGSNAVNGVINIITKDSNETQGTLLKGWGGSEEQGGAARYGGKAGENLAYRGSIKYFNRDSSYQGNDAWMIGRGNIRSDWKASEQDRFMFDGSYYTGQEDLRTSLLSEASPFTQVLLEDGAISGEHFISRWNHTYNEKSNSTFQIYYDQTNRESSAFDEIRYIGAIDWQHQFWLGDRQEVVWGLSYQLSGDRTKGTFGSYFDPGHRIDNIYDAFLQDTISLVPDRLWLTLGSKFEINDYTGFEVQPTARLLWQINPKNSVWAAISRAVSVPSRLDSDLIARGWQVPGVALLQLDGNSGKESESVIAYEAGYRVQPHERLILDLAGFVNDYSHLRSVSLSDTFNQNGYTVQRFEIDDQAEAYSLGSELSAKVQAARHFRFETGYSFLQLVVNGHNDFFGTARATEGLSPDHQLFFRTFWDLPHNIELDSQTRYVNNLKASRVPAYWEMDLRLAWRPIPQVEISVVGQNLFHNHHLEFQSSTAYRPQQERSVYAKTVVQF